MDARLTMADGTFSPVLEIAGVLREFRRPWFVAGGWAIDLFLGRVTRAHEDVDVVIFREDQLDLQDFLRGWRFTKIARGRRELWNERERLDAPVHEIHAEDVEGGIRLEFLLNESSEGLWRFRRNLTVTRPLDGITRTRWGIPFLGPEIVLLYKAKSPTAKDVRDFNATRPHFDDEPRMWLERALSTCHPGHPWIARLGANAISPQRAGGVG